MDRKLGTATAAVFAEIRNANKKYNLIENGDHIVAGLSGGPDSVCLFFALYMMREELGITLSAVHVNHKMRPGAAEEDQKYVEEFCNKLGVHCTSIAVDCNELAASLGITSEEAGRKARYEAFDAEADRLFTERTDDTDKIESADEIGAIKSKRKAKIKIALAHNAEDQAETLLFRIVRGTGTDGLAGIERKRKSENGYTVIRPILGVHRADIEAFCEENKIDARIDKTNLEAIYTRNKIRLELVPYISENLNENITETLNRLASIASEDKEYMWKQAEAAYSEALSVEAASGERSFDLAKLQEMHPAIRHRVMLKALSDIGLVQDVSMAHLENADDIIMRGTTGKTGEFPDGYRLVIRYNQAVFKREKNISVSECDTDSAAESKKNVPKLVSKIVSYEEWEAYKAERMSSTMQEARIQGECIPALKAFAAFDYGALSEARAYAEPILRTREAGDFIAIKSAKTQDKTDSTNNMKIKGAAAETEVVIKHTIDATTHIARKKLQDLLVDSKVPRDQRDEVLVVAVGNEILWIIGADSGVPDQPLEKGRFTVNYRVKDTSKDVLILELGM